MTLKSTRGFTLIEVLIALSILVGGMMMISMAWSGNFLKMRKSTLAYDVATLLERKMVEVETKYRDKFNDLAEEGEEGGDFGEDHPQYRWEMKVHKMKFPDISAVMIGQDGGADEGLLAMVKQMTEFINKTVKEVKITVFVKTNKGKELQYAATQYFVDFTQDFAGGVGGAAAGAGGAGGAGAGQPAPAGGGK
jgi:prepilin-type N-terminal cleavage/methylation domain-containing protein